MRSFVVVVIHNGQLQVIHLLNHLRKSHDGRRRSRHGTEMNALRTMMGWYMTLACSIAIVARCMQCVVNVIDTVLYLCCAVGDVNVSGCILGMERGFLAWRESRARCATRCECSCAAFNYHLG